MNPECARCGRVVYPTERLNCLDKNWHKGCFHCEVCKMALNMNNYKGYEKKPYCNAHYPKQSFTIVTDTPENLRLKQQSELQSQVKYKKDFEESKGRGFSIVSDTPELQRLRRTQEQISNCWQQRYRRQAETFYTLQVMCERSLDDSSGVSPSTGGTTMAQHGSHQGKLCTLTQEPRAAFLPVCDILIKPAVPFTFTNMKLLR
ncbi:LIM zinc-binding domain-containing Nebulette [Arapaima gigas]